MTLYKIEILIHYHQTFTDHPDQLVDPARFDLNVLDLLDADLLGLTGAYSRHYHSTDRGFAYLTSLLQVPLPVQTWKTHWPKDSHD